MSCQYLVKKLRKYFNNIPDDLDVNKKYKKRKTMLHLVISYGDRIMKDKVEIVKELIKHGAKVNEKDKDGDTPLHKACSLYGDHPLLGKGISNEDKAELVQELIKGGANVNEVNKHNDTPLHKAVICETTPLRVVQILIENGADVNVEELQANRTPLYLASDLDNPEIIQELVRAGANLYSRDDRYGLTPFLAAIKCGRLNSFKEFIRHGVNINIQDKYGCTALHIAVDTACLYTYEIYLEMVKILIEELIKQNKSFNKQDYYGDTALHYASSCNKLEMAEELIMYVDYSIKNKDGKTALDRAKTDEMRKLITDYQMLIEQIKEPVCD